MGPYSTEMNREVLINISRFIEVNKIPLFPSEYVILFFFSDSFDFFFKLYFPLFNRWAGNKVQLYFPPLRTFLSNTNRKEIKYFYVLVLTSSDSFSNYFTGSSTLNHIQCTSELRFFHFSEGKGRGLQGGGVIINFQLMTPLAQKTHFVSSSQHHFH